MRAALLHRGTQPAVLSPPEMLSAAQLLQIVSSHATEPQALKSDTRRRTAAVPGFSRDRCRGLPLPLCRSRLLQF